MPITKSAIKKVRTDKRRAAINRPVKARMKSALKAARANPTKETVGVLYSSLDRAVKTGVMKLNTASRLKSRLNKAMKAKGVTNVFGKTALPKPAKKKETVKKSK